MTSLLGTGISKSFLYGAKCLNVKLIHARTCTIVFGSDRKVEKTLTFRVKAIYVCSFSYTHRKKRFASIPSPAGMSLPNSPLAGIITS